MKKTNIKTLLVAMLVSVMSLFGLSGRAMAAGRAIALSPMSQSIVLIPGETYYGGITVANPATSTEDLHYLVTEMPFYPVNENGEYVNADYSTRTNMNMIVDWIKVDNPTGTLSPNEERTVSFSISVPYDAPAGGQYMALLVRENPDAVEIEDSMAVTEIMQMAHVIYAEVAGETNESAEIVDNYIPSFLFSNTLEASSTVKNNGNVHTYAKYTLQVWPMGSDEEICTNEEEAGSAFVMPNTEIYHLEKCDLPMFGFFNAKQTVAIFGEESVVEKMIIVCPLWLLFVVVVVVISAIVWLFSLNKKRKGSRR